MATKKLGSAKAVDTILLTSANLTSEVTGVLPVANGGSGTGTYTDGQLLIGQTAGNTLAKAVMSGGATMTAAGVVSVASVVVANEASDATCFPLFATAATGDLGPKSNSGLSFNSARSTLGIGDTAATNIGIYSYQTALTSVVQTGITNIVVGTSSATTYIGGMDLYPRTEAAAFTVDDLVGVRCRPYTLGATSAATRYAGIYVDNATGATTNYAVYTGMASANGTWNIYAGGTAQNHFAGNVLIGNTNGTAMLAVGSTSQFNVTSAGAATAVSLVCPTFTSAAAMTFTPTAGNNFNVVCSGAGDFVVNTNLIYGDSSAACVGIGTSSPTNPVTIYQSVNGTEAIRISGNATSPWAVGDVGAAMLFTMRSLNDYGGAIKLISTGVTGAALNPRLGFFTCATGSEVLANMAERLSILTGGNVGIENTSPTALLHPAASTTARASLCLPHGSAPTSPVNGDMWTTTAGLYVRINGSTIGPLS